jgi:alpha-tubulin suppressor-like RCC1 family protein
MKQSISVSRFVRLIAPALAAVCLPVLAQAPLSTPNLSSLDEVTSLPTMALVSDGTYVIGGDFRKVFDTPRASLAKLTTGGALVAGFNPSPNGDVTKVLAAGSNVIVAGGFTQIGGVNRAYVAKLAASDGTVDTAFNAALSSAPATIAVDSSGYVYVPALGANAGGVTGRQIVKLDPATGNAVSAWNPTFPYAFTSVSSMEVNGSWLYVAGPTNAACANFNSGKLVRINLATGVVDSGFTPPDAVMHGGALSLAFDTSGNIIAGGANLAFDACAFLPSGQVDPTFAKLSVTDGSLIPAFAPAVIVRGNLLADATGVYVTTDAARPVDVDIGSGGPSLTVSKLDLSTGSATWSLPASGNYPIALFVSGGALFAATVAAGYTTPTAGLSAFDVSTGAQLAGFTTRILSNGSASRVVVAPDGKMYLSGRFSYVNGEAHANLVRLNADGSLDSAWNAATDGPVWGLYLVGSQIYATGHFTVANGVTRNGAARFDAATGALDPTWNPNVAGVPRVVVADGTGVYLGGGFAGVGGTTNRPYLAKVDLTTGAEISAFAPTLDLANISNYFGIPRDLKLHGGYLIASSNAVPGFAGGLYQVGSNYRSLARLDTTTGAADPTWDPNPNRRVFCMAVDGNDLYIGGNFTSVGATARARLAKLNAVTGALDPSWNPTSGPPGEVQSLAKVGLHLYWGGDFLHPVAGRQEITTGARDALWRPLITPFRHFSQFTLQVGYCGISGSLDGSSVLLPGGMATPREGLIAYPAGVFTPTITPAVASAQSHTLALDATGKVYAWGSDSHGQLGLGRAIFRSAPVQVTGLPTIAHVALSAHVLAADINKQVWAWGDNSCGGQLGPRETSITSKPSRVIGMTNVVKVAAGRCFSLALKADGTVWGWGEVPGYGLDVQIRQLTGLTGITDIAAGQLHGLALKGDGTVFAFGSNANGQLGLGASVAEFTATQVPGLAGVSAIAARANSSLALAGGQIHSWGANDIGASTTPAALPAPGGVPVSIALSDYMPIVARSDGAVATYSALSSTWSVYAGFTGIASASGSGGGSVALGIASGGQLYAAGSNFAGQLGQGDTLTHGVVAVPGMASTAIAVASGAGGAPFNSPAVIALKTDGTVWFWGANTVGQRGDALSIGTSVPQLVSIPATIKAIAAGGLISLALDTTGNVWGWGDNSTGAFGSSRVSVSTPTLISGATGVHAIAVSSSHAVYLMPDGTLRKTGDYNFGSGADFATFVTFEGAIAIAAGGDRESLFLRNDGRIFGVGENSFGVLGNGVAGVAVTPSPVQGIAGSVTSLAAAKWRAGAVTSDGKAWTWGYAPLGNGTNTSSPTAVQVTGVTDAAEISVGGGSAIGGNSASFIRRQGGGILAWGNSGLSDAASQNTLLPYPVAFHEPVRSVRAGNDNHLGFIVGNTGLAWGFGVYGAVSTLQATIGDGTFVSRGRPVVILAPGGSGSIDANDWYLDLDPATSESIPTASSPSALGVSRLFGSDAGLSLEATVKYKSADYGKPVNNYVFALVPPEFFNYVKNAPGTPSVAKIREIAKARRGATKDEVSVLAQLTSTGWVFVQSQLIGYQQSVAGAVGTSTTILHNIDSSKIPGGRFCIGYGESAGGLLSSATLREVLDLHADASSTLYDVPCILTGLYLDGPGSSRAGSPVTFKGSVVGVGAGAGSGPTGTVQFNDAGQLLSTPVTIARSNDAVSEGSMTTSVLGVGAHSIGGTYSGDSRNPAVSSGVPVVIQVLDVPPGASTTVLSGASTSQHMAPVTFKATVTGSNPTGTMQFRDGVSNLGDAVPIVGGEATLFTEALGLGGHSITAAYSGDSKNTPSTSSALVHTVYAALTTSVTITSSSNPATNADSITLTVRVTGNNPTGTVTFRDGGTILTQMGLVNGEASYTVKLDAGSHQLTAEYSGDANNQGPVTSAAVVQEVALAQTPAPANPARLSNISTRGKVLTGEDVMIAGFVVGGTTPKTLVINAAGPSLANYGVVGPLANPRLKLVRAADQALLTQNDNWENQDPDAVTAIRNSGYQPNDPLEPALLVTLAPGGYTAIVEGADGGTGVALVGLFEVDRPQIPLVNISTRGKVLTGGDVMIAGFIVGGTSPQKVIINVAGPSLANFNVAGPLANPSLQLVRPSDNFILGENDDWQNQSPENVAAIQATIFKPNHPREPAIVATLPPGAYTAIVRGVDNTTGVATVGVFTVP